MIAMLLAWQETTTEAMPAEAAGAAATATAAVAHGGINYFDLMLKASLRRTASFASSGTMSRPKRPIR